MLNSVLRLIRNDYSDHARHAGNLPLAGRTIGVCPRLSKIPRIPAARLESAERTSRSTTKGRPVPWFANRTLVAPTPEMPDEPKFLLFLAKRFDSG